MIRALAAVAMIASQLLLLWVVLEPTGQSAIAFSFLGHPLLGLGCILALIALAKRRNHEGTALAPRGGDDPPGA